MFRKIKIILRLLFLTLTINQALSQTTFAVIGDFGSGSSNETAVANQVKSWNPDFIISGGDNNYEDGLASTIDENIGKYYADWIFPYVGIYGQDSATVNRFFAVPGNHDWDASLLPAGVLTPYLDYFTLPNNERYYDIVWGDVHFFMIDSDPRTSGGIDATFTQATWIKSKMENSTAK